MTRPERSCANGCCHPEATDQPWVRVKLEFMRRAVLALLTLAPASIYAQDRFPHMPRYDRYEKLRNEISGSVTRGEINVRWADDSKSFTYTKDGKRLRFELKTSA